MDELAALELHEAGEDVQDLQVRSCQVRARARVRVRVGVRVRVRFRVSTRGDLFPHTHALHARQDFRHAVQ